MTFLGIEFAIGRHGGGTHQWNVPYQDVQYNQRVSDPCPSYFDAFAKRSTTHNGQFSNYGDIAYSLALLFTKLSILLLILRVFCSVHYDLFYWLTQVLIWVNSIFYGIYFFIPIFSCRPRKKIWNPEVEGKCLKINYLYYSS